MDKITIAVVSSDRDYGKALSMSLLAACGDVAVRIFDSREFIGEWSLYKGRGAYYDCFDIVLWAGDEVKSAYGGNIVYLTDRISSVRSDYGEEKFSLYKYTSAQNLMSSVFEIYSFLTGRKAVYVKKKNVRLYGFASWEGVPDARHWQWLWHRNCCALREESSVFQYGGCGVFKRVL